MFEHLFTLYLYGYLACSGIAVYFFSIDCRRNRRNAGILAIICAMCLEALYIIIVSTTHVSLPIWKNILFASGPVFLGLLGFFVCKTERILKRSEIQDNIQIITEILPGEVKTYDSENNEISEEFDYKSNFNVLKIKTIKYSVDYYKGIYKIVNNSNLIVKVLFSDEIVKCLYPTSLSEVLLPGEKVIIVEDRSRFGAHEILKLQKIS